MVSSSDHATAYRRPQAAAFAAFGPIRPLLVGGDGIPLERFLLEPAERWVER